MPRVRPSWWLRAAPALALALGAALAPPCAAQDDSHSREREQLRRTQAALREAQAQQAATARERDDLASQRDKLGDEARRAQQQLSASRADAARLNASLAHADEALAAAKASDDAARKELEARVAELQQRLADAQRLADERARANAALAGLLEHATQSLASAEKANRDMHALGLRLIDRIRGAPPAPDLADPVLGFRQIKLENEAEALRDQLDAARIADTARAGAAAPVRK